MDKNCLFYMAENHSAVKRDYNSREHEVELQFTDSENFPIWPPKRKKRRKLAYINFEAVAKTFRGAEPWVLCQLAELTDVSPSNVLKIVPDATTEQIIKFLQIAESSLKEDEVRGTSEPPRASRRTTISVRHERSSPIEELKQVSTEPEIKVPWSDSPTDLWSEYMTDLDQENLVPPRDEGTTALQELNKGKRGGKLVDDVEQFILCRSCRCVIPSSIWEQHTKAKRHQKRWKELEDGTYFVGCTKACHLCNWRTYEKNFGNIFEEHIRSKKHKRMKLWVKAKDIDLVH